MFRLSEAFRYISNNILTTSSPDYYVEIIERDLAPQIRRLSLLNDNQTEVLETIRDWRDRLTPNEAKEVVAILLGKGPSITLRVKELMDNMNRDDFNNIIGILLGRSEL